MFDTIALKCLIAKRQYTICALAQKAGISPDVIYKALAGKRKPTLATIGKIAAALGIEPEELLKEE